MRKCTNIVKRKHLCTMVTALLLSSSWTGFAAPSTEAPDAGQALRNSQNVGRSIPSIQNPNVEVGEVVRPPMPSDTGFKVQVEQIEITGQDLFSQSELDELLTDQLHKERTFTDLNQAAATITQYFKAHGYLLAQAYLPAQEIGNGKVEIAVLVGRYGDVVLKNTSKVSDQAIKKELIGLKPGSYINNSDLERAVLLTGDLAGVAAKITLSPGKNPGTADVVVEAKTKEGGTKGYISFNNWGNRFIGSNQGTVSYTVGNAAHIGDNFIVGISNAGSGLDVGNVNYSLPIAEGMNLNLGYSKVRYSLGADYADLNAHGTAYTNHVDMTWNLKRSRDANINVVLGYDHKRMQDFTDATGIVTNKWDHAVSFGVTGDSLDTLWGGGANSYSLMLYNGNLGAESNTTTPPVGSWNKVTYNVLRQQNLNKRLSLQESFSGQWASTTLDTSEKFSLGGANGVRAYPADEASGDDAWLLNSELHWTIPVKSDKAVLQLIGFYDAGVSILDKKASGTNGNRVALAGKGLGFSWIVPGEYSVKLNYAWKASNTVATSDTDKDGRLWLQGVKYF